MASKRKPLEDARKRVKEKLNAIDEQKDFIENSVEQLTCGVINLIPKAIARALIGREGGLYSYIHFLLEDYEKLL